MKTFLTALLFLLSSSLLAQKTYVHCGYLFDSEKAEFQKNKTLVLEGETILEVKDGLAKPGRKDELVDLSDMYVMPGFIDLHVHIEVEPSPSRYMERFTENEADVAFKAVGYANKTLMAGFTTIRDLGGSGVNTSLRDAINAGDILGPRIYSVGKSIATTGGHADPTNGMKKLFMGDPGPNQGVVNGVAEARQAVRQRYKNGADHIKITATGGVLSVAKSGQAPQFMMDELKAIVETANDYGMTIAAHAHGDEGMYRAVDAGVTTIEHGTLMEERTMDLMVQRGTYLVPTITAGKYVAEKAKVPGFYPPLVVPKALEIGPKIQDTFSRAYKKGVKIAFGTDAGVFPHGENGKEFGYMVEAGMPAHEAIQSATWTAATVLRISDKVGKLDTGRWADLVAVTEDPLKKIQTLENVEVVMKGGVVVKGK